MVITEELKQALIERKKTITRYSSLYQVILNNIITNIQEDKIKEAETLINSMIFSCIYENDYTLLELILKSGVNPNGTNIYKDTPLIIATKSSKELIVELLLKYKADTEMIGNNSKTALQIAVFENHANIVEMLIGYGAQVDDLKTYNNPEVKPEILELLENAEEIKKNYHKFHITLEEVKTALLPDDYDDVFNLKMLKSFSESEPDTEGSKKEKTLEEIIEEDKEKTMDEIAEELREEVRRVLKP